MTTPQTEYLTNGDFEAPGTGPTTLTLIGSGDSAAPGWTTFNWVDGVTTTTELVPSTLPDHSQMLHVTTNGARDPWRAIFPCLSKVCLKLGRLWLGQGSCRYVGRWCVGPGEAPVVLVGGRRP